MSNNIDIESVETLLQTVTSDDPDQKRKLVLKSELLKHLETATKLRDQGHHSSDLKVFTLHLELGMLENHRTFQPDIELWGMWLAEG